jgi:diguanylate cyclase (GGDEF)-like protein
MLIRSWNRFATNHGRFGPGHPEYRRAYLINSILVAMAIMFLIFLALNAAALRQGLVAALNLFGAVAAVAALLWFHRRDRILSSAVATVTIEILVLAGLLLIREHRQYAFYWIMVVPLSSFFLLGRKLGRLFTAAVFVCFAALLVFRFGSWREAGFGLESLFNVALALLSLTLLVGYYEQSRNEAIVALEQKNLELEKLTVTDKLTGIYNRIKLDDVLSYELSNADRYGRTFSIIMGDVDLFKSVNDRFGHVAGDSVLVEMAKLMRNACRRIDTVGRWGGEEFLVICPETRLDGAYGLAERIRKMIESNAFPVARQVTISFGVSEYSPGDDIPSLLRRADAALYAAKSKGRNCVGK